MAGPRSVPTRAWHWSAGRAPSSFVPMFVVGGLHLGADLILRIRLGSPPARSRAAPPPQQLYRLSAAHLHMGAAFLR